MREQRIFYLAARHQNAAGEFEFETPRRAAGVLAGAGVVSCKRSGRQSLYALDPTPLVEVAEYLVFVSEQWDQALSRLKQLVES